MTTRTANHRGCPIGVDYVDHPKYHKLRVQFHAGTYTDEIVFEFESEGQCAHSFMMWQELIVAAETYQRENS